MRKELFYLFIIPLLLSCSAEEDFGKHKIVNNLGNDVKVNQKGELFTVDPGTILQVLPHKGFIPAIKEPVFLSIEQSGSFVKEHDLVLGLNYKGEKRAYPIKILRWRQIVNDRIGSEALLVTYDPITHMGIAYKRNVLDKELVFIVSDNVYNSNPVLKDEATESLWSQYSGQAIKGRLAGQTLEPVFVAMTRFGEWKKEHPDTTVLSKGDEINRDYENNIYADYYNDDALLFAVVNRDERLSLKTRTYGVKIGDVARAYTLKEIREKGALSDTISNVNIRFSTSKNGIVSARKKDTDEPLPIRESFWFAWAAFNPQTEIYGK